METRETIDPSTIEAVANARIRMRGSQVRLQRLLAIDNPLEGELTAARRDVVRAQAALDEAIRVRDLELCRRP